MSSPLIVGLGGSTRPNSTSEKALRAALAACERLGARTQIIAGPDLPFEPYDPVLPERGEKARTMVEAVKLADGLIIASPSYHGTISGLIKNAIDYIEDLRTDARPYLDGRAVGHIVVADGPQAFGATLGTLRSLTHALRGWPAPYAALVHGGHKPFTETGKVADEAVGAALDLVAAQVVEFAEMRAAWLKR